MGNLAYSNMNTFEDVSLYTLNILTRHLFSASDII